MAEHPNAVLLRAFYQALLEGDYAQAVVAMLSEDVVWHLPGAGPLAGDHRGREAVLTAMGGFEGIQVEVHDVVANDDHAVALLRATGGRGGKRYDLREVDIFHVRDGKIAEFWSFSEDQRLTDEFWS